MLSPLFIGQIVLTLFVFVMLLSSAAGMVYMERKVAALMQQRLGPYRVGPSRSAPAARRHHQIDVQGGAAAEGR
jgi:NADH:ubiquinone oxidoreductase subunit H